MTQVVVSGIGMHTSMGGAVQAAAGHRAGLTRVQEISERPYFSEETREIESISGHPSHGVTEGFQGRGRLLRLVRNAFDDLWISVSREGISAAQCGIVVVGPDVNDGVPSWLQTEDQRQKLGSQVARLAGVYATVPDGVPYLGGKVSTAAALQGAITQVTTGAWSHALVVAMDSLLEWDTLSSLVEKERVKTDSNPNGLMPGEAACVLLFESDATAAALGRVPLAVPRAPSALLTDDTEDAGPGERLARVLYEAASRTQCDPSLGTLYSDLSGNPTHAVDFATALVRLQRATPLATWDHEMPAISFGDTGAAAGLLSTCLAARAFDRGYALGDVSAIALSANESSHAAFILERP